VIEETTKKFYEEKFYPVTPRRSNVLVRIRVGQGLDPGELAYALKKLKRLMDDTGTSSLLRKERREADARRAGEPRSSPSACLQRHRSQRRRQGRHRAELWRAEAR
jgi:hypothetical protein